MEELIGKEVKGFEFKGGPGFTSDMRRRIGEIGKITATGVDYCVVKFSDSSSWSYPHPAILDHLVEKEEEEEELTLGELLEQLKKLKP